MSHQERGDFPLCYGCGQENPIGFHLRVHRDGDRVWAEFTPGPYHTGWPDMVHGGVLCVLMDEVVSYLPYFRFPRRRAVTGRMYARFRRPARTGEKLLITAQLTKERSRAVEVRATVSLADGSLVAESDCLILFQGKET